jgi:hypothetical protein
VKGSRNDIAARYGFAAPHVRALRAPETMQHVCERPDIHAALQVMARITARSLPEVQHSLQWFRVRHEGYHYLLAQLPDGPALLFLSHWTQPYHVKKSEYVGVMVRSSLERQGMIQAAASLVPFTEFSQVQGVFALPVLFMPHDQATAIQDGSVVQMILSVNAWRATDRAGARLTDPFVWPIGERCYRLEAFQHIRAPGKGRAGELWRIFVIGHLFPQGTEKHLAQAFQYSLAKEAAEEVELAPPLPGLHGATRMRMPRHMSGVFYDASDAIGKVHVLLIVNVITFFPQQLRLHPQSDEGKLGMLIPVDRDGIYERWLGAGLTLQEYNAWTQQLQQMGYPGEVLPERPVVAPASAADYHLSLSVAQDLLRTHARCENAIPKTVERI